MFYNTSLITTHSSVAGKHPVLDKYITSERISTMFENVRDTFEKDA